MRRATPAGRHDARIDTGKRARCSNGFERRGVFIAPASRSDPPAVDALEGERSLQPGSRRRCREHRAGASRGSCRALGIPLRRLGPRVRHAATASARRAALQSRVAHVQEATSNRASTPSLNRPRSPRLRHLSFVRRAPHNAKPWKNGTSSLCCVPSPVPRNRCPRFRPLFCLDRRRPGGPAPIAMSTSRFSSTLLPRAAILARGCAARSKLLRLASLPIGSTSSC